MRVCVCLCVLVCARYRGVLCVRGVCGDRVLIGMFGSAAALPDHSYADFVEILSF